MADIADVKKVTVDSKDEEPKSTETVGEGTDAVKEQETEEQKKKQEEELKKKQEVEAEEKKKQEAEAEEKKKQEAEAELKKKREAEAEEKKKPAEVEQKKPEEDGQPKTGVPEASPPKSADRGIDNNKRKSGVASITNGIKLKLKEWFGSGGGGK